MLSVADAFDQMSYGPAPESPAAAQAWLSEHGRRFDLFIGGAWTAPSSKDAYIDVTNPADGALLAQTAEAGQTGVDQAVQAAREAFAGWSGLTGHERARHLYALARSVQKHARLFAVLESLDNGKPIRESRDLDVPLVARHLYHHAGWAQLVDTEMAGYAPLGVVGQVIPWNFPLLILAWKIAPALAMGNTVVLKPAPATPLTALLFAEVAAGAGLPPGVLNIVTGGDDTGKALVAHPGIDKVAFTGSTAAGRAIRQATAGSGKALTLELGGKSPYVVFEDADLDGAVEGLVDAIWFNQGEVCCAGSRLLVQESIEEDFLERLRRRMDTLRVGSPLDKAVDVGAVVDRRQRDQIQAWVDRGVADGATCYQPTLSDDQISGDGHFFPPTLLTNVSPSSAVVQEEIFGPVLVAMSFRTPAEAIALANNTRYGLAGTVWSENINLALEVAHRIKAGVIWINGTNFFDAAAGFGGYRESGFGREGGKAGLYAYVRPDWQARVRPDASKASSNGKDASADWGASTPARPASLSGNAASSLLGGSIDRTAKLYVGGKQARPDGEHSRPVYGPKGQVVGTVGDGNRKDIRNAVEAAHKARGWADRTPHNRAQILFYLAENLAARADEFAARIGSMTGGSKKTARQEVEQSISRLFTYAAWADKFGGSVNETLLQGFVVGYHDYLGVVGIACPDEAPLLGFVSLVAPAICRGDTVVAIPSEAHPLAATDLYQVLDTSDLPAGVVNIVTGSRDHLAKTLVEHDHVDAMWYFGTAEGSREVERRSATNMKRTWVGYGQNPDWASREQGEGERFLRAAVQLKTVWIPTGV